MIRRRKVGREKRKKVSGLPNYCVLRGAGLGAMLVVEKM
jgi:hypothetical protein